MICYSLNGSFRKIALGFMADSFFLIRGYFFLFFLSINYPMNRKKGRKMVRRNDNTILYGNLACRIFQNMRE